MIDRSSLERWWMAWSPSSFSRSAEATDRALAAVNSGLPADVVAQAFGAGALERAWLASGMRRRDGGDSAEQSAFRSAARPDERFTARLETDLLHSFSAEREPSHAASGHKTPFGRRTHTTADSGATVFSMGRRHAAALAAVMTVLVALFARIGPGAIGGMDPPATAIAATETVTVRTPVAIGTAEPAVAHRGVDG